MKKFNNMLFLAVAMVSFSAFAMDDSNISDAANRQLIKDAQMAAQEGIDLYGLVGVSENATQEMIEKARRTKLKENHPDKKGGNQAIFKALNNATEILKYAPAREKYDAERKQNASTAQAEREAQEHAQRAAEAEATQAEDAQKAAEEQAARQARFEAQQAEWRAKAEQYEAKLNEQARAERQARDAQVAAYRQELRGMTMAQTAEKFNFYKLLGITPDQCDDFGFLRQCFLKQHNIPYTLKTLERLKNDEELEYAYDTLRLESKRKAYDAALKEKRTRKRDHEDAADRPTSRRRQEEASSSLYDSISASITAAIGRMFSGNSK